MTPIMHSTVLFLCHAKPPVRSHFAELGMSVSFTLLPCVPEDEDNSFLYTLSAKSDELLESKVRSVFLSLPCNVRLERGVERM